MSALEKLPLHSPLGGSGAERWMRCSGSVRLSHGVREEDGEDDTFSGPGHAAHAVAEACLVFAEEPWHLIGCKWDGVSIVGPDEPSDGAVEIDKTISDAVQVYVDLVRVTHPDRNQGNSWVERNFHCPQFHKYFYGRSDFTNYDETARILHVWDYKHGAGIVVEADHNPQLMYYACGMLEVFGLWTRVDLVVLHIVQPRGWHYEGPHRVWSTTPGDLMHWLMSELLPAMNLALVSRETASGEHCRFCPARKRACPQLLKDVEEMEKLMEEFDKEGTAAPLTNEQVARFLDLGDVFKIALKAAEQTAFSRLQSGNAIPGRKLANAKVARTWKEGAEAELSERYGDAAYTTKELLSPAKIEALPEGKKYTERWAFKPPAGLVVVKGEDYRPAINKEVKGMFTDVTKKGAKKNGN